MSKIVGIVSGKGGVGKTTLCANLAFALAAAGKSVMAIDADIGLKNLDILLGMSDGSAFDLTDVLEGRCTVAKAIQTHDTYKNLHFISASQNASAESIDKAAFYKLCRYLRGFYDFVLLDAPAGVGQAFTTVAQCCDECIVVATPDLTSIRDAEKTSALLATFPRLTARLVINKVSTKLIKKGYLKNVDEIMDSVSLGLLGLVPADDKLILYSNFGKPAVNEKSLCSKPLRNIAKRLMGEDQPLDKYWRKK